MSGTVSTEEVNRMRWASRRGMLELDLLLEPFVQACYAELDDVDRQRFQQLMRCEDQELFGWFLQREQAPDREMQAIVGKILSYAHTEPGNR